MDPVPEGPKTCRSGSPTLVRNITVSTFVTYTCGSTAGHDCSRPNGVLNPQALLPLLATVVVHSQLINQAGLIFTTGCGAAQTVERRLAVRQARVRIPSRHPFRDPSTERQHSAVINQEWASTIEIYAGFRIRTRIGSVFNRTIGSGSGSVI